MVTTRKQVREAEAVNSGQAAQAVSPTLLTPIIVIATPTSVAKTESSSKNSTAKEGPKGTLKNNSKTTKPRTRKQATKKPKRSTEERTRATPEKSKKSKAKKPSSKGKEKETKDEADHGHPPIPGSGTENSLDTTKAPEDSAREEPSKSEPLRTLAPATRRSTRRTGRAREPKSNKVKTPLNPLKPTEGYGPQRATEMGPEGARSREVSEDLKAIAGVIEAAESSPVSEEIDICDCPVDEFGIRPHAVWKKKKSIAKSVETKASRDRVAKTSPPKTVQNTVKAKIRLKLTVKERQAPEVESGPTREKEEEPGEQAESPSSA